MDTSLFLKGLIIGFAMDVPIGPLGVLCIRKTLTEGHSSGLTIGLGGATADLLYGSIAVFGATFVSNVIASQEFWVHVIGGGILLFLGVRTLRARRKVPVLPFEGKGLGSYASAFLLGLTNPVTIVAFAAVFAAFGLGYRLNVPAACILITGIFGGSCLWFVTLGFVATFFRKRLNRGGLRWVSRISGGLIILSGVAAFASLI